MSRGHIYLAGKDLADFGLYVSGYGTYNTPEKDYSEIKIPGRSGNLIMDNKRLENLDLKYPASFIFDDFDANFKVLKNYLVSLKGYQRLEDTYNPDEFRIAYFKDALDVSVDMWAKVGVFDIVFKCKPQRFLKSGEEIITLQPGGTRVIYNPTNFESKPLLRVYGTGSFALGSQTIRITEADAYTDIDCEMMDCYKAAENRNQYVTMTDYNFPVLKPGNNSFSFSGITKIEVIPRWWVI